MDTAQQPYVRDDAAVRTWRLVREPFTARAWRRVAYALLAAPVGLVGVPVGLAGGPAGRWQRGLVRRFLGVELSGSPRGAGRGGSAAGPISSAGPGSAARGVLHALLALPLNLAVAVITLYGWSIVPMNLGWPLRGGDPASAWGGPTFAGAWAFHAAVGGVGFLLLMPWLGRATALLARPQVHEMPDRSDTGCPTLGSPDARP